MKNFLIQVAYYIVIAIVSFFVEKFISIMIAGVLSHAADKPLGDISETAKRMYSVGIPVLYGFLLFGLYLFLSRMIESFKIRNLTISVLFHIFVTIYLIWNLVPDAF